MSGLKGHLHNIRSALSSHSAERAGQTAGDKDAPPRAKTNYTPPNVAPPPNAVDLTIQFISASGLPKMDVGGLCDPYFVVNIDDKVEYVSTAQPKTLDPVWNEVWHVKNVPPGAALSFEFYDKDEGAISDDYIGKISTTVESASKTLDIMGRTKGIKGRFSLNIIANPAFPPFNTPPYTFDGPIRYSRHQSPTVGRLTNLNQARLFSTWKIHIKGISLFFNDVHQPWNKDYKAAQSIFGPGPLPLSVRTTVQAGHRLLYARSTTDEFGLLSSARDFWDIFRDKTEKERVKPAVYTYIIDDSTMRFSETGAAFFVDFASKHALHANCATAVRYSGEFHPRPSFPDGSGWGSFNDSMSDDSVPWELVIDNNSGTYAPNPELLQTLRQLLEYNFPGMRVVALDFKEDMLTRSREACREYALKHRGVGKNELQPTNLSGGETLCHQATVKRGLWGRKKRGGGGEVAPNAKPDMGSRGQSREQAMPSSEY